LIGLLAVLFAITEIGGLLLPDGSLRFISPPRTNQNTTRVLDGLGAGLKVSVARVGTAKAVRELFDRSNLDLKAIRRGQAEVPGLFLLSLPEDLAGIKSVQERKDLFVGIVLPLVLHQNSIALERRTRLQRLIAKAENARSSADRLWLLQLARLYRVVEPKGDVDSISSELRAELLRRIDIIPVSLGLAQSAAESGWGTSRFARRGNALFGQWTWDTTSGLVPNEREEGRAHTVRAFKQLANSVRAYAHNLNSSHHYAEFRATRALLRRAGPPNGSWGLILVGYLDKYSEEGVGYIEKIRSIIRVNKFGDFETAKIENTPPNIRKTSPGS
jgi:Bax protein